MNSKDRKVYMFGWIITALLALSIGWYPAHAKPVAQAVSPEVAFVDFNGGSFLVPRLIDFTVPLTTSPWSIVENKSTLLNIQDDRIYVLQPGVRVVISGQIKFTPGNMTYFMIGTSAKDGANSSLYDMNQAGYAVFTPLLSSATDSFSLHPSRSFTQADFAHGNPYIFLQVKHNASLQQSCFLYLEIDAK